MNQTTNQTTTNQTTANQITTNQTTNFTNVMSNPKENIFKSTTFLNVLTSSKKAKANTAAYIGPSIIKPKVEEGRFVAVTTNATYIQNKQTKNGLRNCIEVTFSIFISEDKKTVDLRKFYWESDHHTFNDEQQLSNLLGEDVRNGFHVSDLIGKCCEVEIMHQIAGTHAVYANIVDVYPITIPTTMDIIF